MKSLRIIAVLISLIILLVAGCTNIIEKDRIKRNKENYEKMNADLVNLLMDGKADKIILNAKIEGRYLVYYYTNTEGLIARVPIDYEIQKR